MQTVTTKYLPATNTRGSRIKVTSWKGSKTYSYDHSASCAHQAAFDEWLLATNKAMKAEYGTECPADGWYKLVAKGNMPDGCGYGFIIK